MTRVFRIAVALMASLSMTGVAASNSWAGECEQSSYSVISGAQQDMAFYAKDIPSSTWSDRIGDGANSWNSLVNNCGFTNTNHKARRFKGSSTIGAVYGDGYNRMAFGACGAGAAGCTLSGYNEFDIVISTSNTAFSTIGSGCGANYDLWSIVTHELGHTMRLNHASGPDLTMYSVVSPSSCGPRTLGRGDILGLRAT